MAEFTGVQFPGTQDDKAQAWEDQLNHGGTFRWYGLAILIAASIVVVVAAFTLTRAGETTAMVSHVGDQSQIVSTGHLLLTEWDVTGLGSDLSHEIMAGDSVLELHNDGQTVHRLAIWRGGVVEGDQVVGGALVAETGFIRPGEMSTLDVDLEPGKYVLICSVRGHGARGMHATVELR